MSEGSGSSIRTTQRAPRRCVSCAQKRVKCDLKSPCNRCIKLGIASTCKREPVYVNGSLRNQTGDSESSEHVVEGLVQEVAMLRDQVQSLQEQLEDYKRRLLIAETRPPTLVDSQPCKSCSNSSQSYSEESRYASENVQHNGSPFSWSKLEPARSQLSVPSTPASMASQTHSEPARRLPSIHSVLGFDVVERHQNRFRGESMGFLRCESCKSNNLPCDGQAPCSSCQSVDSAICAYRSAPP